jgi:hypothetical protein
VMNASNHRPRRVDFLLRGSHNPQSFLLERES